MAGLARLARALWAACLALLLMACAEPESRLSPEDQAQLRRDNPEFFAEGDREDIKRVYRRRELVRAGIGCRTHGVAIAQFFVQDMDYAQTDRREFEGRTGCAGMQSSGYLLPSKWLPGLRLRVRWRSTDKGRVAWHEKYTTVPSYSAPGDLWVHFFPDAEVRVVVSRLDASSPFHAIEPRATRPPREDSSHIEVPVDGVNLGCVAHGVVRSAPGTLLSIENPNFSNPERGDGTANLRSLPLENYAEPAQRDYARGCLGVVGLQLDRYWRSGRRVAVFWQRRAAPDERKPASPDGLVHLAQLVAVPRYARPLPAWLHLFPNDEARLVFSEEPPESPLHPIARGELTPPEEARP